MSNDIFSSKLFSNHSVIQILESWKNTNNTLYTTNELLDWIAKKNEQIAVTVELTELDNISNAWYYDKNEGCIRNNNNSFFQIYGIESIENDKILAAQPIILQREIGYLGIIGKVINGMLYFFMQAKIEPGNVNKIQISPTLQATKSNYMQKHGGNSPKYLEYFSNRYEHEIIVDQIQSEQSSRFYGKRNRNMIIIIKDDIEEDDNFRWMTLGQIKELMAYNNLVNMDTRTVLSCIPFSMINYTYKELSHIYSLFSKKELFNSFFMSNDERKINNIYQYMNDIKMENSEEIKIIKLYDLPDWYYANKAFTSSKGIFEIVFAKIKIEGREVSSWSQPLLRAKSKSIYGLLIKNENGCNKFLVHCITEIGCFDVVEIGPTIQSDVKLKNPQNEVVKLFYKCYNKNIGVIFSGLFSEEGGRFYHEQNLNVIIEIGSDELTKLPPGYFWVDYRTLNILVQFNNCLNIQLRNLLSIIRI